MTAEPPADLEELTAPGRLLRLLDGLPAGTVIGFEPTPDHLAVHTAALRTDERVAAAGLFGLRAEPGWIAAGVVVEGRVRSLGAGGDDRGRVRLGIVVHADGTSAHRVDPLGHDAGPAACELSATAPEGLLLDGLLRMLGRPSASAPPPAHATGTRMWAQAVATAALDGHPLGWRAVIGLHPGRPATDPARPPSSETLVAATLAAGELDWVHVHQRAVNGHGVPPDLRPDEVAWMDPPMYARWVLGALADESTAAMVLRAHDEVEAADRFEQVCARTRAAGAGAMTAR